MANTGPSWTDNVTVQAPYGLLKGDCLRTIVDLRSVFGAVLKIGVGRYATGNLNVGLDVIVRRVLNNDAQSHRYSAPVAQFQSDTAYGSQRIDNIHDCAAGVSSIAFYGQTGAAFAHGDALCFWGQINIPAATGALSFNDGVNMEILRCSAGTSTPLVTDSPIAYIHRYTEYFTLANAWELWLPGGSTYALIFDAGGVTTASGVFAVMADMQRFDKLTKVV